MLLCVVLNSHHICLVNCACVHACVCVRVCVCVCLDGEFRAFSSEFPRVDDEEGGVASQRRRGYRDQHHHMSSSQRTAQDGQSNVLLFCALHLSHPFKIPVRQVESELNFNGTQTFPNTHVHKTIGMMVNHTLAVKLGHVKSWSKMVCCTRYPMKYILSDAIPT